MFSDNKNKHLCYYTSLCYNYRVQGQVNEVIDVMRDNIGKVLDRGEKLSELEIKSGL